jgi:fucose permease
LILASIIAIFIYGMIAAMLGTILPDLSNRFKLSPSQNGTIAFAQALGLIIASVSVGPLLDDEGKKVGIVLGLALIAIALSILPRAAGYRSILILLFLLGIGGGTLVTGANSLASDVGEAHRAGALNLANLFFGLGALATPFIAANLFKQNWVRLCYTITLLTVVTYWGRTIRPRRGCSRPGASAAFHDWVFSLPLYHLRGGSLELAAAPSDRSRHS